MTDLKTVIHRLISLTSTSARLVHRPDPERFAIVGASSMDGKRKLATDDIVAQAMEEEEGRKRLKKNAVPVQQGALAQCI